MSRVYAISDYRGERRIGDAELPLRIGGADCEGIALSDLPADSVVAVIALSRGHAFIQPLDPGISLFHNGERLGLSAWLKSGDQVQVGDNLIRWSVKGDQVFIDAQVHKRPEDLIPPPDPLPDDPRNEIPIPIPPPPRPRKRRALWIGSSAIFSLLVLALAFVLVATPVTLHIEPAPERFSLDGFPPPLEIGQRLLTVPGGYVVHASKEGFRHLEEPVNVNRGDSQEFRFVLKELPGRVSLNLEPAVPFRLAVDGIATALAGDGTAEIARGRRLITIETERYLKEEREIEIQGLGKSQSLLFALRPAWAQVWIGSRPAGAEVRLDDQSLGSTPLTTEIMQGKHELVLSLDKHKPYRLGFDVFPGTVVRLDEMELEPADGKLKLDSDPSGATVSVDGKFRGTTPVDLVLTSNTRHRIRLGKSGFRTAENEITLAPEEQKEDKISLRPEYGVIFLTSKPGDAELLVDGKPVGKATQRLRLTARTHKLEIRKPGYATYRGRITPKAGVSQNLDVVLKTEARAKIESTPRVIRTSTGQRLLLIRPGDAFTMGASRREAGRRANESRRLVKLDRPFYIGEREVTNAEFRRFRSSHNSGSLDGAALDAKDLPAVNLSWDDAARYCNWLSRADGLPPAYAEKAGRMSAITPMTRGYRLPTEAEWAYVARVHGRSQPVRYSWNGTYPPVAKIGNFADARIADTLAQVVPGYDDGYRGTAPPGSFPSSPEGFFDLSGNVAEWTHDLYAIYPGEAANLVRDPAGPPTGEHHVVRGSSWRHGNITELRLSYRDYSQKPRQDLGFRIARYAE